MTDATSVSPPPVAAAATPAEFPPEQLLDAYRWMVLARVVDERSLSLQRQGRIGFYAPLSGQEAAQVGAAYALRPEDWVFPAYRELAVALVRGASVRAVFDQLVGNSADLVRGAQMPNHFAFRAQNFVSASSPIGTQISQAVGAAMAVQRRHDPIVTVAFFGDGATSSNDFHAGMNFAGVFRTPTIFFCQNNQWAISLPRERQTRSATLAEKAGAYGFPGVVVDGHDLNAVYQAVAEARRRAIAGEGPTLIEALVYRFGPHSTSDDPKRYRSDAEVKAARSRDPIDRLRSDLTGAGKLDAGLDHEIWETARSQVVAAFEAAEKVTPLDPLTLFENVYSVRSRQLDEQRSAEASFGPPGAHHP